MVFGSSGISMWKVRLVLSVTLLVSGIMPASLAHATSPQPADSVRDLWIDVSLGPPLIDWFNQVARPDDIARVEHVRQFDLLDEVTTGRKLLVIRSIEEAERILPSVADQIDIIGYNLEMGRNNLPQEQADPVASVQRMHDLAHEYDLLLAFGPDHDIALSDGAAVAPYVDIFILQVQRVQTEPATVPTYSSGAVISTDMTGSSSSGRACIKSPRKHIRAASKNACSLESTS